MHGSAATCISMIISSLLSFEMLGYCKWWQSSMYISIQQLLSYQLNESVLPCLTCYTSFKPKAHSILYTSNCIDVCCTLRVTSTFTYFYAHIDAIHNYIQFRSLNYRWQSFSPVNVFRCTNLSICHYFVPIKNYI